MVKLEQVRDILIDEYTNVDWEIEDGVGLKELTDYAVDFEDLNLSPSMKKAKLMYYLLANAKINVNPHTLFADTINISDVIQHRMNALRKKGREQGMEPTAARYKDFTDTRTFTGTWDFGHTSPDWKRALDMGFKGVIDACVERLEVKELTAEQRDFYESVKLAYEGAVEFTRRLSAAAKAKEHINPHMTYLSAVLDKLTTQPPETLFEAMEFMLLYYQAQHLADRILVRTFGGIDTLLYPYYKRDMERGIIDQETAREYIKYFLFKMYSKKVTANIPFYLGGVNADGEDLINPLTYMILEEYIALNVDDPKIHIKYHKDMDERLLKMVLTSIRDGKNSFVIVNDDVITKALIKLGIEPRDARNYTIVGCYEPAAENTEVPCTCNGEINILKAVELALTDGMDIVSQKQLMDKKGEEPKTFEEFYKRVTDNLSFFARGSMALICEIEGRYMELNPSLIYSGNYKHSFEMGRNLYEGGAKYNSSSINAYGIANAVDSLMVIKQLVYDEKKYSLSELAQILKNDWQDNEQLRLKCNAFPKRYGNNIDEADKLAANIYNHIADCINGKPNGRGGVFRLGAYSIDWRIPAGKKTGASPDGRRQGEPISKNLIPMPGNDKKGVTALISSVTKIDFTNTPSGSVFDLVLHESATRGDDGICSMLGLVKTYFAKGGGAVHINVLNAETLKKAQKNPQQYKNLQVRLCGWNVYFVDLDKTEQDDFIKQAENLE